MYELKEFPFMGKSLRVVVIDGEKFYFVASDVCKMLGLRWNSVWRRLLECVPAKDRIKLFELLKHDNNYISQPTTTKNRNGLFMGKLSHKAFLLTESGLYRLIMRSNKPEAKKFQNWVYNDVLPTLRATGTYTIPGAKQLALTEQEDISKELSHLTQNRIKFELSIKIDNGASVCISECFPAGTSSQKVFAMWADVVGTVNSIL